MDRDTDAPSRNASNRGPAVDAEAALNSLTSGSVVVGAAAGVMAGMPDYEGSVGGPFSVVAGPCGFVAGAPNAGIADGVVGSVINSGGATRL